MKDHQRGLAEFLARCLEDTQQQAAATAHCGPVGDVQESRGEALVILQLDLKP